jgi:hypothetical protein
VTTMTTVAGERALICRVASNPFGFGYAKGERNHRFTVFSGLLDRLKQGGTSTNGTSGSTNGLWRTTPRPTLCLARAELSRHHFSNGLPALAQALNPPGRL